jgi:hypothetical protein
MNDCHMRGREAPCVEYDTTGKGGREGGNIIKRGDTSRNGGEDGAISDTGGIAC